MLISRPMSSTGQSTTNVGEHAGSTSTPLDPVELWRRHAAVNHRADAENDSRGKTRAFLFTPDSFRSSSAAHTLQQQSTTDLLDVVMNKWPKRSERYAYNVVCIGSVCTASVTSAWLLSRLYKTLPRVTNKSTGMICVFGSYIGSFALTKLFVQVPMNDTTGVRATCTQCLVRRQVTIHTVCTWVPLFATPSILIGRHGFDALSLNRQHVRMLTTGPWQHMTLATAFFTRDILWPIVRRYALPVTVAHIVIAYTCVLWQLRLRDMAVRALYASPELFAEQFTSMHEGGMSVVDAVAAGWRWVKNKITPQRPPPGTTLHDSATPHHQ